MLVATNMELKCNMENWIEYFSDKLYGYVVA
jgi:hypothetical protein